MDDFTRVRAFLKVVEAGSFSAAARDVSSASAVARQIKALEEELGVRLLNRNTRNLALTDAGRLFHSRMTSIVTEFSAARAEVKSLHEGMKGVLRVSLRTGAGMTVIVPALPTFLEQYPDLSVSVSLTDEKRDLIANEIDVAVWLGEPPNMEIVAKRLSPSRRIVCASTAYLQKHGRPNAPEALTAHNCLVFEGAAYSGPWHFTRSGETKDVIVKGSVSSDSSLVLLSSCISGAGIIIVQQWMVQHLVAEGTLERILTDWDVSPRPGDAALYAAYPTSRGLSRKVRVFIDFLVKLFAADKD
ncbi:LysR family transcriptional regulator [Achromobacter marplatensis]|uniref:LysR family transcriptional regulator n=1 Tax=Achromobacter marplatensis TaxID=470868 RepID=UPI0028E2BB03|nr:LysR family transcriptional regulator [Achromobacter marplatensis]